MWTGSAQTYDVFVAKLNSVTSVNEISNDNSFSVYPNPANQSAVISWSRWLSGAENKKCELKIFDVMGKEIWKSEVRGQKSEVDVSKFENGIYFVQLQSENKTSTQKLIIQH